jgi:hypothetical protein
MNDTMRTSSELEPEEIAFNQRINAVYLCKQERNFEDVIRDYRQIEEEFVERLRGDENKIAETKRRVTEWILSHAFQEDQAQKVCRGIWEELLQRGFSNDQQKHDFTGIYARCCQQNGEFDEGLTVLEPLIEDLMLQLRDNSLTTNMRTYYEGTLASLREIRDELKAGIRE